MPAPTTLAMELVAGQTLAGRRKLHMPAGHGLPRCPRFVVARAVDHPDSAFPIVAWDFPHQGVPQVVGYRIRSFYFSAPASLARRTRSRFSPMILRISASE
jgi:hypothetical protein